jgi:hypothetical protein
VAVDSRVNGRALISIVSPELVSPELQPERIEVVSVKTVPADANVRFVPEGEGPK